MAGQIGGGEPTVIIKKYANRRLYNTQTSSYVTLDHLAQMVKAGVDFVVQDARSGDDITHAALTQIIVEEEAKGSHLLPTGFLRQLIRFYGDNLESLLPQYLEMTMQSFTRNQDQIRNYLNEAFGGLFPFNRIEEMSRRNLEIFEQSMNWIAPDLEPQPPHQTSAGDAIGNQETSLDELRAQMAAMQSQIDALSGKQDKDD